LQPCNLPTMPPLSPPSHNLKSDIYPFNTPRSPRYLQHQATTATPTPKDGILRAPRYHDHSCDSLTQKYPVQSKHLVPQSDTSKHGTSVRGGQQNFCLQGGMNDASGPKVRRVDSNRVSVQADRKSRGCTSPGHATSRKPTGMLDLANHVGSGPVTQVRGPRRPRWSA
jgi:hypothetical protein